MSQQESDSGLSVRDSAVKLYQIGAIRFGDFTLTSGKKSPYYVDMRIVPSYPELFNKFGDMSAEEIEKMSGGDRIGGVPTGGLAFAAIAAHKIKRPLLYTRKKEKSHGRKKAVEGVLEENEKVIIVDDIATTGGSIQEAAETIRDEGGKVSDALVMIDREEKARKNLSKKEITLHSCLKISNIVKHLEKESLLNEKEKTALKKH